MHTVQTLEDKVVKTLYTAVSHGETSDGKKRELTHTEFSCVENKFREAFKQGLISLLRDREVASAFCRLFNCANEKRSRQYGIAFVNELTRMHNPAYWANQIKGKLVHHANLGDQQAATTMVQNFLDYMAERVARKKVAA